MSFTCLGLIFVMHCQMAQAPAATQGATFCSTYAPVYWSAKDTRKSKEQNDKNNRKYKRLCTGK